ncbi:hypothetical protein EOA25_15820 [Mesorhizobium sp. M2A.F.Ca.ET.040.01.1.1]|nr:hypothetical protein EOA25_15820 [Mesorhizobium sp. M2A.F.Ca.ET.040.01.1.1]
MPDDESLRGPPLCPAGHLRLKGGDQQLRRRRPIFNVGDWRKPTRHPISPLEGEMSGRTERGATE